MGNSQATGCRLSASGYSKTNRKRIWFQSANPRSPRLHYSVRMKHYHVVEVAIIDQSWVADYVQTVTKLIEQRGGRYLARTSNIQRVEGERPVPKLMVIVEWPSREVAEAFYASEEYRPYLQNRLKGARNEALLIAGEDVTKAAQILE